jgi:hypothetical protein
LRESLTTAPVPATAATQAAVAVAIPDRWQRKFSAVRSAVSSPRTGPRTIIAGRPGISSPPSSVLASTS